MTEYNRGRAEALAEAVKVLNAYREYDSRMCCDGRECGCQGASVFDMIEHYIRALSHSPGDKGVVCGDCGRLYGDEHGFPDLVLPNADFAKITDNGDENGLLCPSCLCARAHRAGLSNVPAVFRSGPFAALSPSPEWVMVPREKLQRMVDFTVDPAPTTMTDRKVLDWVNGQARAMLSEVTE